MLQFLLFAVVESQFYDLCLMSVGYLKEEGCIASYRTFLKEMKHLNEYRTLMEAGQEYPTSICGKNLTTMLNEYGYIVLNGNCCLHVRLVSVYCIYRLIVI